MNVTVFPATGASFSLTVAVTVWVVPTGFSSVTGVRSMFEMNRRPSPRARMYGIPNEPSGKVIDPGPPTFLAIASGRKSLGKALIASCTEHDQLESDASVRPMSAGCVATMCALL